MITSWSIVDIQKARDSIRTFAVENYTFVERGKALYFTPELGNLTMLRAAFMVEYDFSGVTPNWMPAIIQHPTIFHPVIAISKPFHWLAFQVQDRLYGEIIDWRFLQKLFIRSEIYPIKAPIIVNRDYYHWFRFFPKPNIGEYFRELQRIQRGQRDAGTSIPFQLVNPSPFDWINSDMSRKT